MTWHSVFANPFDSAEYLKEVHQFMRRQHTWFELEEKGPTYLRYSTRENGDIGEERPGEADVQEAKRLARLVREQFEEVKVSWHTVDEWVDLEIFVRTA
jgi:hypothetical protein